MTFRAVILGLALAALIAALTYFNDFVLHGTFLVGNYMPVSVFGGLLLLALGVNPLLGRVRRRWSMRGAELATIVAVGLVACAIPGRGLMHYFTTTIMRPVQRNYTDPSWEKNRLLELIPDQMLATDATKQQTDQFSAGIGDHGEALSLGDIPWQIWQRPLIFWIALLGSIYLATMALAVVVHRQWSVHERLRYPISTFAHALLPQSPAREASVLRERIFWIAVMLVVLVHLHNYTSLYYPKYMTALPVKVDLGPIGRTFGAGAEGSWEWLMSRPFYLTAVGFAYFLATDLSLSLGIAPYVWGVANYYFTRSGTPLTGWFFQAKPRGYIHGGTFFATFLMLVYYGRRFFSRVFARAMCLPIGRGDTNPTVVWAARAFLVAITCFILQLVAAGVNWPLAVLYALGAVVIYTVLSRIVAETGAFYLHAYYFPCMILLGFLGLTAMDLPSLGILFLVSSLLFLDPREAVMPYMVTGLKLVELNRVSHGRTVRWGAVSLLLAFAIATPVTLYIQYDHGANNVRDGWTWSAVPFSALNSLNNLKTQKAQDPELEAAEPPRGLAAMTHASPNWQSVGFFLGGMVLVMICSFLRLRFTWWPIHPVLFLLLGTSQSSTLSASFLLGCAIKVGVTHFAGQKGYNRFKPFMMGIIAGDVLGAILPMMHGTVYYWIFDTQPEVFRIMPV